jgi:hypothetical protein
MKLATSLVALSFALVSCAGIAEEKAVCHESPRYLIVEGETGGVGTNLLVKYRHDGAWPVPCRYKVARADFEIKNESAEYFLALHGDLLILDGGTGPEPRGLVIWNLQSRRKVYAGSYSEPYEIQADSMEFWMETGKATDENCPDRRAWESSGLGAAIETRVRLSFSDFTLVRSSEIRCRPRQ